jgi:trehalose 6-phosphate synthase/phosphatase
MLIGKIFKKLFFKKYSPFFMNYEDYFNSYMDINKRFGDVIYNNMQENDLIMIHDVHLMLIPSTLLTKNTNSRVGIYFHMALPSSDVLKSFPYHQEILKSILLCDVIGFHVFQFARNFLTACKRLFGIFYEIKFRGFITLNYLGRYIIIRIMHAGIDVEFLKSVIIKKEFSNAIASYKKLIKNKFCLVSIDQSQETSGLYFKFEAYKRFLEKFPEVRNKIMLLQIVKCDETDSVNKEFYSKVEEISNQITDQYSNEVIKLIKVDKFSIPERYALFSLANSL